MTRAHPEGQKTKRKRRELSFPRTGANLVRARLGMAFSVPVPRAAPLRPASLRALTTRPSRGSAAPAGHGRLLLPGPAPLGPAHSPWCGGWLGAGPARPGRLRPARPAQVRPGRIAFPSHNAPKGNCRRSSRRSGQRRGARAGAGQGRAGPGPTQAQPGCEGAGRPRVPGPRTG